MRGDYAKTLRKGSKKNKNGKNSKKQQKTANYENLI